MTEDPAAEDAARAKFAEALTEYYEACRDAPGIVTGYVVVYEITPADGVPVCFWMTGTGATPGSDREGMPRHRGIGLLDYALHQFRGKP